MLGINKVILVGTLGRDPESFTTNSGSQIVKFSLATSSRYKGNDGKTIEETEWHNIVVFGKLGEVCAQYLKKGSNVYIEGKIKSSTYEKNGQKRINFDIIANDMTMLGGGKPSGESSSRPAAKPAQNVQKRPALVKPQSLDDLDEDIPF